MHPLFTKSFFFQKCCHNTSLFHGIVLSPTQPSERTRHAIDQSMKQFQSRWKDLEVEHVNFGNAKLHVTSQQINFHLATHGKIWFAFAYFLQNNTTRATQHHEGSVQGTRC